MNRDLEMMENGLIVENAPSKQIVHGDYKIFKSLLCICLMLNINC